MRMASSRGTGSVTVVVDTEIDSTTWVISRLIMAKPYQELVGSVNSCNCLGSVATGSGRRFEANLPVKQLG